MGAAAVLETAAETPPMRKSVRNALASLGFRATSDIFTKTKGQRFGKKKKLTSQAELIRRSPIESGSSSNVEKNIGRPIHDPTIFFSFFFPRKHGVKHAHLFFSNTLIQCHRPFAGKRGSEDLLRQPRFDLVQGE